MKRIIDRASFTLFVAMFIVWILLDTFTIIETPLSFLGVNHWIPELMLIFYLAYRGNSKRIFMMWGLVSLLFLPMYIGLANENVFFGIGTSCLFLAFFLVGARIGAKANG